MVPPVPLDEIAASDARLSRVIGLDDREVIRIVANDATHLDWLEEALGPLPDARRSAPGWEIRAQFSRSDYLRIREARPAKGVREQACFAFDSSTVTLPTWSSGRGLAIDDEERSAIFFVRPGRIDIVGDASTRRSRSTLLLIVSELIANARVPQQLDLHAACVVVGDRALVLLGPKRAGKTTVSLHLLATGRAQMVSNDRTFVGFSGAGPVARGLSTMIRIRPETAAQLPQLHDGRPWTKRGYTLTVAELAECSGSWPDGAELLLSAAQVAERLGARRVAEARVGELLFLETDGAGVGIAAERMTRQSVETALMQNVFGGRVGGRRATVFDQNDRPHRSREPLAAELARSVSGFRVRLGSDAYGVDFAGRLLHRLARA